VRTLRALDRVAAIPPVWDAYTLARHPLLLVADSTFRGGPATPVCAAIWRAERPLERIELAARPPFSTPLYGMIDSDPVGPRAVEVARELPVIQRPAPQAVVAALRERGITRAIVLNVPLDLASLGALGRMLQNARVDPVSIQADLAVHETFHLHAQFPTWLDQTRDYAWPAWDVQPDRVALRERCYAGSPQLVDAVSAERDALVAAFDAVVVPDSARRDTRTGLQHARRFLELRASRRELQDTMTVAQGSRTISCGDAEDLMELEEGVSQWIGHATTARAGVTTIAALRASYAGSQPERFYQLGPLQLWVLDGLVGSDTLRQITADIARSSTSRGGVFGQLTRQVERLAERR
jgi:hypothetical protein